MPNAISLSEVKKHNTQKSTWIVIHNDVYDVTAYLNEHPGGEEALLEVAGTDGTQDFEDVGHSEDARNIMKKYKIGSLPIGEQSKQVATCQPAPKSSFKKPSSPKAERRVQTIVVPRERRPRGRPCEEGSNLKWALLALAGAILIGVMLKKYAS